MAKVKFLASKVPSSNPDGFKETIKYQVLMCSNVEGNNNKFWCVELQHNESEGTYRLFTHYGRLQKSSVYEERALINIDGVDHEITEDHLPRLEKEFDRLVKKKQKGKSKKRDDGSKYTEKYELVDTSSPDVGSPNIRGTTVATKKLDSQILLGKDPEVNDILGRFYDENIHNITSVTSFTAVDGGLRTAIGQVTEDHIAAAQSVLDNLKSEVKAKGEIITLNNQYLSMIPRKVEGRITQADWIDTPDKISDEYELLDQLKTALSVGSVKSGKTKEKLPFTLKPETKANLKKCQERFERERASNHGNLRRWKVCRVFKYAHPACDKRFIKGGDVRSLWHGSKNCNLLSIMTNGLIVPPSSAGHVTGRMFGDGIYAANTSTKALNYSTGFWAGGVSNKYPNAYLLLVEFSMGTVYDTHSSLFSGAPSGYDSVHAHKGRSLYNDELIVYTVKRARITHLVELEER